TAETTAAEVCSKLEALYMTKSLANKLYLKKLYAFYMPTGRKIFEHIDELNKIVLDLEDIEEGIGKKGAGVNNGGRKLKSINDSAGCSWGLNKDEQNAIMDLCGNFLAATSDNVYSPKEKFSADMSNLAEQPANVDIGFSPNPDIPIVQSVFIPMPVSYAGAAGATSAVPKKGKYGLTRLMMNPKGFFFFKFESRKGFEDVLKNMSWMIRNSPLILKKWTMNTMLFKEELTRIPVWVKLHDVPIQVFLVDGISLIATQICKLIMLDSFTSLMCTDSWGWSSFARCLIEVRADAAWKDNVTMAIPFPDVEGFTKETFQVDIPAVDKMNNGFQMVVNKRKSGKIGSTINNRSRAVVGKAAWQPIKQKVNYEPEAHRNLPKNGAPKVSSSAKYDPSKNLPATKEGLHVPTSKPSVLTFNPYVVLNDMESNKEAEVIYDETVILNDTRTGASPSMALDGRVVNVMLVLKNWHKRLGHISKARLQVLEKQELFGKKSLEATCTVAYLINRLPSTTIEKKHIGRCGRDIQLVGDREPMTRTKPLRFRYKSNMDAYAFAAAEQEDTYKALTYQEAVACEDSSKFQRSSYSSFVCYGSYAPREYIYPLLYVGDLLIACKSKADNGSTKSSLKKEFDMKELGEAKQIIGMEIVRDRSRKIRRVSQSGYVSKVLINFRVDNEKSVMIPLDGHFKRSLKDYPVRDCDVERITKVPYANAVGSLINVLDSVYEARHSVCVGLVYGTDRGNHVDVTGFVNSDYAKDPDKETKHMALKEAVEEAIWLKGLLEELGVELNTIGI
nr:zinc knuckle CX2CX4HX4C [Tanacetum cinerariifolium]